MRRGAEALLVLASLVFLSLLCALAEIGVRVFTRIDLLGNSRHLFVADAFGTSKGNAPNVVAESFGATVYIDEHGFRVPEGGVHGDAEKPEAILILGDSVGFGPAIAEPDTFAGLLRARFPERRIYNSSVIGYATFDYVNVVNAFLPQHPEVTVVVLVFCLNDVSTSSSRNIDRDLERRRQVPEQGLTERLRSITWLSDANDYLRSRSKLYLFLRHRMLGTQLRDWKIVLGLYGPERQAYVEQAARDVAEIAAATAARRIPLVVVLSPFEYQLRRPQDPETQVPQAVLGALLAKAGVAYIDPRSDFDHPVPAADYYLAYDSMHFAAPGHRVMADVIARALGRR